MQRSPGTPTPTARSSPSTTCTLVPTTPRPIGTRDCPSHSPATSYSVAVTPASVGPYAFSSRTPDTRRVHCPRSPGPTTSPPRISSRSRPSPDSPRRSSSSTNPCQYAGVTFATVTPLDRIPSSSSPPTHGSPARSTTVAPHVSPGSSCSKDASKLAGANCSTRSVAVSPYCSTAPRTTSPSARRSTITPLGRPVEPEV